MSNVLLKAQDVHKTYLLGKVPLRVLRGVNVDVRAGELLAVTGASVGTTTLTATLTYRPGTPQEAVLTATLEVAVEDTTLPSCKMPTMKGRKFS